MADVEVLFTEQAVNWEVDTRPDRRGIYTNRMVRGLEGGPQAVVSMFPEQLEIPPHFHDVPQFQVLLEGSMYFPESLVEAIAVHYTDPRTPYGPLIVERSCKFSVLRPGKADIFYMANSAQRGLRNPYGREISGQSNEIQWEKWKDTTSGVRRKVLFGREGERGPRAHIWEYPPDRRVELDTAPFGEYHLLVEGSALFQNREMKAYSGRYVIGEESPTKVTSGPKGSTWIILTFCEVPEERHVW